MHSLYNAYTCKHKSRHQVGYIFIYVKEQPNVLGIVVEELKAKSVNFIKK